MLSYQYFMACRHTKYINGYITFMQFSCDSNMMNKELVLAHGLKGIIILRITSFCLSVISIEMLYAAWKIIKNVSQIHEH